MGLLGKLFDILVRNGNFPEKEFALENGHVKLMEPF